MMDINSATIQDALRQVIRFGKVHRLKSVAAAAQLLESELLAPFPAPDWRLAPGWANWCAIGPDGQPNWFSLQPYTSNEYGVTGWWPDDDDEMYELHQWSLWHRYVMPRGAIGWKLEDYDYDDDAGFYGDDGDGNRNGNRTVRFETLHRPRPIPIPPGVDWRDLCWQRPATPAPGRPDDKPADEPASALVQLYTAICLRAERNMEQTGTVSGAHWNALRQLLTEAGQLEQAEAALAQARQEIVP